MLQKVNQPTISICMATYNGGEYLKQQIDSIFAQSNQDWQLLIRDDGSCDDTITIIEDYIARCPGRVKLVTGKERHLGASLNFGQLLEYADTEYIMFSDQDDIWLPNKIELTLNVMKATEQIYPDKPVLTHTDLKVVDSDLNIIADSMWSYQKLFPEIGDDLSKIMAQNVVTGCTMMINRKARDVSTPIPAEAIMHDWWTAINVAKHGKIVYVSAPSILYRQHSKNEIGAQKSQRISTIHFLKKMCCLKKHLSAQYRMVKKIDPDAGLWLLVLNRLFAKIAQWCR